MNSTDIKTGAGIHWTLTEHGIAFPGLPEEASSRRLWNLRVAVQASRGCAWRTAGRTGSGRCRAIRKIRLELQIVPTQPLVQHRRSFEHSMLAQRAFPYDRDPPAGLEQCESVTSVALHVGVELRLPEFRPRCRGGGVRAACMSVPEAAVNETHCSKSGKHQIGGAGQLANMQTKSETTGMECPTQDEFR